MPHNRRANRLRWILGALCLSMLAADTFTTAWAGISTNSQGSSVDDAWSVTPDSSFQIAGAGVPNVGWVDNQVWLIVSARNVGPRLYRSETGMNDSLPETVPGLNNSLNGTGQTPVEPIPREAPDGTNEIFVAGMSGQNQRSVLYRLRDNGTGTFVRSPLALVYDAPGERVNVPDIYATTDGKLRLVYIENFSIRGNAQIAISTDGGASFAFEFNNPFGDHDTSNPDASNTNVDPAVLRLKSGEFVAVTMRQAKLYVFTSADGLHFVPTATPPIEGSQLFGGGLGLFDPTLAQLPDGRIVMYVTVGTGPASSDSSVIRAFLGAPSSPTGPRVEVTSPNGGEIAKRGKTFTITWSASNDVGFVSQEIELSTDRGATFSTTIASNLSGDARSFAWSVPTDMARGKVYRMRVVAHDSAGNSLSDSSDANFKIK